MCSAIKFHWVHVNMVNSWIQWIIIFSDFLTFFSIAQLQIPSNNIYLILDLSFKIKANIS